VAEKRKERQEEALKNTPLKVSRISERIIALGELPKPDPDAKLKRAFRQFDRNGDGKIDVQELQEAFRAAGREALKEEVEGVMKQADVNFDGSIDFEEFKVLMGTTAPDPDTESKLSRGSKVSVTSITSARTVESLQRASNSISDGVSAFKGLAKGFMSTSPKQSRTSVETIPETAATSPPANVASSQLADTSPQSRTSSKSSIFSSFGRRRSGS
jgi:hypothetical protein